MIYFFDWIEGPAIEVLGRIPGALQHARKHVLFQTERQESLSSLIIPRVSGGHIELPQTFPFIYRSKGIAHLSINCITSIGYLNKRLLVRGFQERRSGRDLRTRWTLLLKES